MATACDQQSSLPRRNDGRAQINACDRPTRSFANAIFVDGNDDGWLARLFLDAASNDANDTRMPAFAR